MRASSVTMPCTIDDTFPSSPGDSDEQSRMIRYLSLSYSDLFDRILVIILKHMSLFRTGSKAKKMFVVSDALVLASHYTIQFRHV